MSLLFIRDTVGMVRDLVSLKKNPIRSLKRLKKTPLWKNAANFYLSVKYGVLTEASDIEHIISKTSLHEIEKKKSFGTCFDQSPIYGRSVTDIHTRYLS